MRAGLWQAAQLCFLLFVRLPFYATRGRTPSVSELESLHSGAAVRALRRGPRTAAGLDRGPVSVCTRAPGWAGPCGR